ncbi:hypothetical protein SM14VA5_12580 [Serratia marcescens]|nr:hypothetical protein SM14VA5_12580 [Serratia marcescens]
MPPVSKLKMLRRRAYPRLRRLTFVSFILSVSLLLCGCVTSPASDRLSRTQHVPATWRAAPSDSAHVSVWNAWPSARNESGARRLRAPAGKPSHVEHVRGTQTSIARANLECAQTLWNDARKLAAAEAAALYYASRTCRRQHAFSTQSAPLPESFERAIQTPPRRASQSSQKEVAERGKAEPDGSEINRHTTQHSAPRTLDLSSVDTDPGESEADWQAEPHEHHNRVRSTVRKWIRRLFTSSERAMAQRQAEPLQNSVSVV